MCNDKKVEIKEGMTMEEVWRDIPGFEGLYQASTTGKIKSLKTERKTILAPALKRGYESVLLVKDGRRYHKSVHRLVAMTFIPNPENKEQVNHLDENKRNNHVENLEWATAKENINWGTGLKKRAFSQRTTQPKRKAVYQYDKSLNLINVFQSCHDAARQTGYDRTGISHSCQKKKGFTCYKGYIWEFA